jgi:hypothetical protein
MLYDAGNGASDTMVVPVSYTGGYREACGAGDTCGPRLACVSAICEPVPEVVADCAAATPVALVAPTAGPTHSRITVEVGSGSSNFESFCADPATTSGDEALVRVTVPAGAYTLTASTAIEGVPMDADTVLHMRRTCEDPGSSPHPGCNDGLGLIDFRSALQVAHAEPGDYTIFVEFFGGVPTGTRSVDLDIELRAAP